jgi:hypothetical protein
MRLQSAPVQTINPTRTSSGPLGRLSAPLVAAATCALYLLLACVITYPLVTVLDTRFLGHPFSDSYELARHVWWLAHALQTGQPLFEQPLLAYPDGLNGALLWAYPLQSFPAALFALIMPLPAAFNLAALLGLALNGWSVWLLARWLMRDGVAALVAGTIFLAYSSFQTHLAAGHTGLLALWPFALYGYAMLRLREDARHRWIALGAACFVMSGWGSTQLLLFTTAPFTVAFALTLLKERNRRALLHLLLVLLIGGMLALAFALPLLQDTLNTPAYLRLSTGVVDYSSDLLAVVAPSFLHPLYGDNPLSGRILGVDPFEATAYIGLVAGALALLGILRRSAARWWLALGMVAWVCSLGPLLRVGGEVARGTLEGFDTGIVLPWAALYDLPILNIVRTPGRFNFLVALTVALMAAYGVQALRGWLPRRWGPLLALVCLPLILFDAQFWWDDSAPLPDLPTVEGVVPPSIAALASRDNIRAVFDVPWAHPLAAKEGLWLQTGHQRPLIAGHMARQTPVDPAKLTLLETTLDLALLEAAGVDLIILHREWADADGALESRLRDRLGEPTYSDDRFAVFEVPSSDVLPVFTALTAFDAPLTDTLTTYVYTPETTEARLTGRIEGNNRLVTILLDEQPIDTFRSAGEQPLDVPLALSAGYHRLTLAVDPPCPPRIASRLACRDVIISQLEIVASAPSRADHR